MSQAGGAIEAAPDGVRIRIKVVPGASRSKVVGMLGDRVKVAVSAPPEGNKANSAVCKVFADAIGVAVKAVQVTAGHTQPRKTITVFGVTHAHAGRRLDVAIGNRL